MNAQISNLNPLSPALRSPFSASRSRPARRHCVGNVTVRTEALDHFNQLLARLQHFPLHRDQVATASRELAKTAPDHGRPAEIEQRLQRVDAVTRMIADASWQAASYAVAPARLVTDYVRSERRLIPHGMPAFDQLDDAILIDAAWPQLADEIGGYLDFCRLRAIEAELRGCQVTDFAFSHDDWKEARQAEAGLATRARRAVTSSYLPGVARRNFRVF